MTPTRSWLHEGTPATKRKLARVRDIKAKEELVVEAALAWVETCSEDGPIADEAETALVEAIEDLKAARAGRRPKDAP